MQEEVTQKTIALVIKAAKLDANILKSAMRMYPVSYTHLDVYKRQTQGGFYYDKYSVRSRNQKGRKDYFYQRCT